MKRTIVLLLLAAGIGAGCSTRYNITLTNGEVIRSINKPTYDPDQQVYVFKRITTIPAGSVREIAPASMKAEKPGPFLPTR